MKNKPQNHYTGLHNRCIELSKMGKSQTAIKAALGVSQSTISRWLKLYKEKGSASLEYPKMGGSKSKLNKEQEDGLKEMLKAGASAHGFEGDFWTQKRIADIIEQQYGIKYKKRSIGDVLKRLGFSYQKMEKKHYKKDEKKVQEWKDTRLPNLKKS